MLHEKFYMVFTCHSAGKMWSSICKQDSINPGSHYQINLILLIWLVFSIRYVWQTVTTVNWAACQATTPTAQQYLTSINSKVLFNAILHDAHNCQYFFINQYFSFWSLWYRFSFSFPVYSFFLPRNALNANDGLNYLDNFDLFNVS